MTNWRVSELAGQKFGMLIVKTKAHTKRYVYWNCLCDCGNVTVVRSSRLISGNTKSCGCFRKEIMRLKSTTHGNAGAEYSSSSSEYKTWLAMKNRCYYPSNPRYEYYGGKGIVICAEWINDFSAFLQYMGPKPSPKHSIDRIDGNKNYEPGNVRWATSLEQRHNRSKKGVIMC